MKSLSQYITEAAGDKKFIQDALRCQATDKNGIYKFYEIMLNAGILMHPDDDWANCTYPFTTDEIALLNNWVDSAFKKFGEKLYEIVDQAINTLWKAKLQTKK